MATGPAASTIRWAQKEAKPIAQGACLLIQSQLGYQGRRTEKECSRKMLQMAVGGGSVVDPLNPNLPSQQFNVPNLASFLPSTTRNDLLERANVVAVGIQTFANLLAQGRYPGSGGYTLNAAGEKVYETRGVAPDTYLTELLPRIAQFVAQGAIPLPSSVLPTLEKLGGLIVQRSTPRKVVRRPSASGSGEAQVVDYDPTLTPEEEKFLKDAARSVNDFDAADRIVSARSSQVYRPTLPKDYRLDIEDMSEPLANSKESKVPSSRIGRLASFGQLAIGLAGGAVAEITKRTFGMAVLQEGQAKNPFLSQQNADRIVQTLCRVRGAALKLGQMLSIQDSDTVPPALLEIFERVRHSADFMPLRQVNAQMTEAFGPEWRGKFASFEDRPFAAASIGQVHKAILHDGRKVAVKIQYPGVAEGIDSDIDNLVSVLSVGGLFPKGMFLDAFVTVARRELRQECDYRREARAIREFRRLIASSKDFFIPAVIDDLSSDRVLTTEFIVGKPVDQCLDEPQVVRDYIAGKFIELCLKEIFEWRFMQTDPNWSNFYLGVHPATGEPRLILLDFGASRPYPKKFVDKYMQIIKAAYDGNDEQILQFSREIGFLTGYESEVMEKAHVESVRIMGETLASDHPYDFSQQNVTKRIHKLVPVMLEHRLTSPPEEIYSLHRKLSGSYLLATKLKATVSCGGLFNEINRNYRYGEDDKQIEIDYA